MTRFITRKFRCPCCGKRFEGRVMVSTNTCGSLFTDLRHKAVGIQPESVAVKSCPYCGYAGFDEDFDLPAFTRLKVRLKVKKRVSEHITPSLGTPDTYRGRDREHAAWIAEWKGEAETKVARLYQFAAWCAEDAKNGEKAVELRRKAGAWLEKALGNNRLNQNEIARIRYLAAEHYRRGGLIEKAGSWYDLAIEAAEKAPDLKWLVDLARQQKTEPKQYIRDRGWD